MNLLTTLLSLCLTTTFTVSAAPTPPPKPTGPFHLKTVNAADPSKNNLYVSYYHTGAATADADLTTDASTASKFTLNGTKAEYVPSEPGSNVKYSLVPAGNTGYNAWEPVHINAPGIGGEGSDTEDNKFAITDASQFIWNGSGFGGWLACDWSHNEPQLFWLFDDKAGKLPSSCSKVGLEVVGA